MQSPRTVCVAGLWLAMVSPSVAAAEESFHGRIDALIAAKAKGAMAARTNDAEFVRRVFLDFAGRIPTADEARKFLADRSPQKRVQLIDRLLNGPEYPRRMTEAFDVMLMERRGDEPEWTKFLRTSFEANKPWDQIVREIVRPNPDDANTRGSAYFWTKRLAKYGQNPTDFPGLAADLGRLFLGKNLACAQCHNHLFIDDYKQADFQGLFAFVQHTSIRTDTEFPAVAENVVKARLEFQSVFEMVQMQIGPRVPGRPEITVPVFKKGEEYSVPPDKKNRAPGILKFSPLSKLAEQLPQADTENFAKNIVNRLWFLTMGRGLVEPLDLFHSKNPPSHPELLELLAKEFVDHKFDIKWCLRELALTETYQRSSVLPESVASLPVASFQVAVEKPLSAEQLLWSMLLATGENHVIRFKVIPHSDAAGNTGNHESESKNDKLKEYRSSFLAAFANPPREPEVEFSPSVSAALFVLNDGKFLDWVIPKPGNLIDRLSKMGDAALVADELYLSLLARVPSVAERAEVVAYLENGASPRGKALGQVAWALMASTEFCINH
ncbi:MAG: DUF1553 domain-containing protein [Planctomycetota bacterium]|nr:DUF1553 domain-containing protein [Planctomycetota bacterium]